MLSMVIFILTIIKKFAKSEATSVNRRSRPVNQETNYGEEESSE
jgi:hypothetical protein